MTPPRFGKAAVLIRVLLLFLTAFADMCEVDCGAVPAKLRRGPELVHCPDERSRRELL